MQVVKRFAHRILAVALVCALVALTGCSAVKNAAVNRLKEIKVTSFKVDRIVPQGLKSLEASFYVGIDNPTIKLSLSDVTVQLFNKDTELGTFALDPFTIEGHAESICLLTGTASLPPSGSLFTLLGALGGTSKDELTVVVHAVGKGAGIKCEITRTMPLNELLQMVNAK